MKTIFDFFYYTQTERKACVLLLVLCALAFVIPHWVDFSPQYDLKVLMDAPRPVQVKRERFPVTRSGFDTRRKPARTAYSADFSSVVFAPFDPNQVSKEALLKMGLPRRCAEIWIKYRSKGGHFRRAEEVQKIYGLPEAWYQKAKAYLQIPASLPNTHARGNSFSGGFSEKSGQSFSKPCAPLDVNRADTAEWQRLRGIGRVLAARIVKFRDKLGGFYSLEQVKETYGLADSVFQKIYPCLQLQNPQLKPLAINQMSLNELASHPYIGFKAARGILYWKDQHGPFSKSEDLAEVTALEPEKREKLQPYLQF
jgi:DNA uptake protein ComE-like DNA-binding protein